MNDEQQRDNNEDNREQAKSRNSIDQMRMLHEMTCFRPLKEVLNGQQRTEVLYAAGINMIQKESLPNFTNFLSFFTKDVLSIILYDLIYCSIYFKLILLNR